ncbi:MAG TPA: T9SS type A sorting domain-containing protein [Phaeodactylibacter sp.]|nr:T9SS type A sorting domain-containing protein [Phaeodactylibacter sp.]
MKKCLLFTLAVLFFSNSAFAQNSIQLNIHHKLGAQDFALDMGAKNNIDNDFKVTRLEYYLSEISIIHDGGTVTNIEDFWALVDATEETIIDLGMHNINDVEAVHFYVGVDPEHNHLDPASWPADHPLAPQFPSMHWGWTPGYRFLAIEGYGGTDYNQLFQLHGIGDENYFKNEVDLSATANNGAVTIDIYGDYTRILENISVNEGVVVHGAFGDAKKALQNTRDFVFSSTVVSDTEDLGNKDRVAFKVFPNPTEDGLVQVDIQHTESQTFDIIICDVLGREVHRIEQADSGEQVSFSLSTSGLYFVQLMQDGQVLQNEKLMVQ